jgi:hypothetical protein
MRQQVQQNHGGAGEQRNRIRNVYQPQQTHPWHGIRIVLDRTSGEFQGWVFVRPATASVSAFL